jgi:drug/metabolite transporter (DMT)-like permease
MLESAAGQARLQRRALALLWLVPALWTVNYIVARKAPGVIGPYLLAFGRWGLAALVLLVLARQELWRQRADLVRTWWQYLVLGALGMVICGAWVYQGARSTGAMNIALIYSAAPVLIGVGAVLWLGEHFSLRQRLGVLLAMAGVLHVVVKGQWTALASLQFAAGDLWILAATFAWAAYALLQKQWASPLGATARLAAICSGGVLLLLPLAGWEMTRADALPLSAYGLWLIVVAAIVPGLGAYWIYGWAQKMLGASRVAVSLYLGPLYAAFAAWGVLGEPPGWHHAMGALLILPGVFLVTWRAPVAVPRAVSEAS